MRTKFITTGRIIAASICGICQFMLIIGGVFYWKKFAQDYFPETEFLKGNIGSIAALLGLLSLVWPMYVFAAAKRSFTESKK
jgi:ABC-type multidrug transport system fused ATPase/permease subunit